jgi:hypothetical protein
MIGLADDEDDDDILDFIDRMTQNIRRSWKK